MLCKDCEHFKIRQQPLRAGGVVYDAGLAECKKYGLVVEFTNNGKFKWLSCDNRPKEIEREGE